MPLSAPNPTHSIERCMPLFRNILIPSSLAISCAITFQSAQATVTENKLSYSDLADLTDSAPIVAVMRLQAQEPVYLDDVRDPKSRTRYYLVTGKVDSLIRGKDGIPQKISFLVQAPKPPLKTRNRIWKRGSSLIVFARPSSPPGSIQLVSNNAAQTWSTETETVVRAITTELLAANPPPAIMGPGDSFHVAGTVEGESETQIFLKTATGAPVSLSVIRRPGESARWGVSLGEIVDDAAIPPPPGSLLWYRLACSLPDHLPATSTRGLSVIEAEAARRDYRFIMESLGSCGRTL